MSLDHLFDVVVATRDSIGSDTLSFFVPLLLVKKIFIRGKGTKATTI